MRNFLSILMSLSLIFCSHLSYAGEVLDVPNSISIKANELHQSGNMLLILRNNIERNRPTEISQAFNEVLDAEIQRIKTEKKNLEMALAKEELLKQTLQIVGGVGLVVGIGSIYVVSSEVALGLVGLYGGLSAATYAMAQIHFTAKDIELAKKRIEFVG